MQPDQFIASPYGQYVLCLAELSKAACEKSGIHVDSAKQAVFSTIMIDAEKHLIFINETKKDREAAKKADDQIKEIDPNPTPEKAEQVKRKSLLEGIENFRVLLNSEGLIPTLTSSGLNTLIKNDLKLEGELSSLDGDSLETVIKSLSEKLDGLRASKSTPQTADVGF